MTELSNAALLRKVGLATRLRDQHLQQLADVAIRTKLPPSATIFREGKHHEQLYWVVEGVVSLEMTGSHAGAQAVLTVGSGDLLAWSALVGNQRMTATATTATEALLIGFDSDQLRTLCEQHHEIGFRLMQSLAEALARRLVATRLQLLDLFDTSSEQSR